MSIRVAVVMHGHQGDRCRLAAYRDILGAVCDKRAPYSVDLTGTTIENLRRHYPETIQQVRNVFSREAGSLDPYKPEILATPDQHMNLVPLELELDNWGVFMAMARRQVRRNIDQIHSVFGIHPRGVFPAENVLAPAAAAILQKEGMAYVVIDGVHLERLGIANSQIYAVEGTRFVSTNRYFGMCDGYCHERSPWEVVQRIKQYAHRSGIYQFVLACDLDLYEKIGWDVAMEVTWLMGFADALFQEPGIEMVNVASIADWGNQGHPIFDLRKTYAECGVKDPHHFTSSWIGSHLNEWLSYPPTREANSHINDFIRYDGWLRWRLGNVSGQLNQWRQGRGELFAWCDRLFGEIERTEENWFGIAGMEFRHPGWVKGFSERFYSAHALRLGELRSIDNELSRLEHFAFH